jgi:hypothetical protein
MSLAPRRKLGCPMTCRSRSSRSGVAVCAFLVLIPAAAIAAELPPIRTDESNRVADCATPGRLTLYLKQRNPKLNPRYEGLATEYMRHGEALHVRWDYAFFQMLLETGYLTYGGDVKAEQNNFAGLGATGKGARGESFKDISTGARAHIEHLVMYSGERVENPVAERTRNVQDWGVLTDWQKSVAGPITFSQLAKQWAPGSRRYASDMETIANRFFDGVCKEPDPQPELVAALGDTPAQTRKADAAARVDAALKAAEGGAAPAEAQVAALPPAPDDSSAKADVLPSKGAAAVAAAASSQPKAKAQAAAMETTSPPVKLLNPAPTADVPVEPATASVAEASATAQSTGKSIEVAALPGTLNSTGAPKAKAEEKPEKKSEKKPEKKDAASAGACRVWTASYGGSKAIIIKAVSDKTINYTVLDVNEGAEKREAEAYINAYAKGGQSVGEFPSQTQALEKAFELCPEG